MQSKIIKHFNGHCPNAKLITFVRYKEGPKAKNAAAFEANPVGKVTDYLRKFSTNWFLVVEHHADGTPHVHAIANIECVKESMHKYKYARVHILPMELKTETKENEGPQAPPQPSEVPTPCVCANCIYNSTIIEDTIFKAKRKKSCLFKDTENSVSKIVQCTSFYLAKQFYCAPLERYTDYNCSCKLC